MPKFPNCGEELVDDNRECDCPFCGYEGWGDEFFHCYDFDTLVDRNGDLWECENCCNEGIDCMDFMQAMLFFRHLFQ